MKHYYINDITQSNGFTEVSEDKFYSLVGTDEIRPYISKVYRGLISIDEVPEELREQIQTIVNNKITQFGEYENQEISSNEFQNLIEEVL